MPQLVQRLAEALTGSNSQTAPTADAPVAQQTTEWPEGVVAGVFQILDKDLKRECDHLNIAKSNRPATCRNTKFEQSDIDKLAEALGPAVGNPDLLTREIHSAVAHVGHTIVSRAIIDTGHQPYGTVLMYCNSATQDAMVRDLARAIRR